jgi:cell division protein FtsQ
VGGESPCMAGPGRAERMSRRRTRAASVVVPFPRSDVGDRLDLVRLVPSGRTLLFGFGLLAGICTMYWAARTSSVFSVRHIEVHGAPPAVAHEVESTLSSTVGTSLLELNSGEIEDKVRALPSVAAVKVDRAFPHTLVLTVAVERPVAVARRGPLSWLVTGSGHVIRDVPLRSEPELPRLWITHGAALQVGGLLPSELIPETKALAALREFPPPARVRKIRLVQSELTLVLSDGREVRLGDPTDVRLKLAVAARVFPLLPAGTAYLDVSIPERPVSGTSLNSQVETYSSTSTPGSQSH